MPFAPSSGRIHYRLEGCSGNPLLVLVHSLGASHGMWDLQMPAFTRYFQVLRVDLRGHGASDAPAGDYTIAQLAGDVLAASGGRPFHYCGLSLGGMIGQYLAARHPDRIQSLILANTSPRVADPSLFETRRTTVLGQGMAAIEAAVMQRFFSDRVRETAAAQSVRAELLAASPVGYAGCCAAIRDMDHRSMLGSITAPTLIVGGDDDQSTPWQGHGSVLAASIPGARTVKLPGAHLSNIERPGSFTAAVLGFLTPDAPEDAGEAMRRAVLGDAHVDHAKSNTTDFTRDFQNLITRYAWGAVWTRPGLSPRTRRLLVLTATAALGRWEEFRLHVRTGLARELEPCDIEEVLLQVAIYAGVPAANTGFQTASEELRG
ncbi:MAG: 3-oxoadipate enol-lactonase [Acidobacteria bacterium]|nr:3-oxoadipate enol-lactonase [Acidobacteriota bacterium]